MASLALERWRGVYEGHPPLCTGNTPETCCPHLADDSGPAGTITSDPINFVCILFVQTQEACNMIAARLIGYRRALQQNIGESPKMPRLVCFTLSALISPERVTIDQTWLKSQTYTIIHTSTQNPLVLVVGDGGRAPCHKSQCCNKGVPSKAAVRHPKHYNTIHL